ncbi:hypothetical protein ASG67_10440 [Sphingomonas sp. Leaf339]|uniref:spike base protein, RCAP_Rcc01079 family n=1 Tax=Sphingomonas sp. Leaf339 TaxID=1736343 RepID=UPI0006FCC54E|nr:hypothetical protein [Sphingomonas sp. Leaf339]KQU53218.1 hypothetical protein ASG67_10440 [Sphingomonas sp. Leaf339]
MPDPFAGVFSGVSDPGERAAAITPSDTADLPETPKSLYVGTGGDIAMIGDNEPSGSVPVIWRNVPAGAIVPFRPRRIRATDTTAADIVAIY